jgi:DNA-binding transcriptional LysR family regulator
MITLDESADNHLDYRFTIAKKRVNVDRLAAMRAFAAVVEQRGFAPAARKLGQSPTVTTRLVGGLERHLKVRLLNRTTRSVSLTDAGARFLAYTQQILQYLAEAERMVESEQAVPAGRLTVTAPLVFGRMHVAPLMGSYLSAHRQVQAELLLSDRIVNLVEDGIDVAVRIGVLPDSGDVVRKVGATRRVLVASPEYCARRGTPLSLAELALHDTIAFTGMSDPRTWRFNDSRGAVEVDVAPRYLTNSADAAIAHAVRHGGVVLALSYQVVEEVRSGALRVLLRELEPEPLPIQVVYPSSRFLAAKVRAVVDVVATTASWDFGGAL